MRAARNNWIITDQYRGTEVADQFHNLDRVFNCSGEKITSDPISQVVKIAVAGQYFYVKRYHAAGNTLRRYFGKSRIQSEWENLIAFAYLGVPTPTIVAYGQRLKYGQFKGGALITAEIANSIDLAALVTTHPNKLANKSWRISVMIQVAEHTRTLHNAGYVHGNLNWRNILVTLDERPKIYFIDCPAGGLKTGRALIQAKRNDLAFLDKLGRLHLTFSDQLRFYKYYQQISKLTDTDKRDIKTIYHSLDKHRLRKEMKQLNKESN